MCEEVEENMRAQVRENMCKRMRECEKIRKNTWVRKRKYL
jgi:hypothetical protein